MSWIQIKVNTNKQSSEALSDLFLAYGALSITFLDALDEPILEPLPGEFKLWSNVIVCALYDNEEDINRSLLALSQSDLQSVASSQTIEIVEDKDWQHAWKASVKPIQISTNLWICPSWKQPVDPSATNIMLDPGLAFGTGSHPTTALCLEWLSQASIAGKKLIDYGCGSGILTVCAHKLGAQSIDAVDIDTQAIEATKENCLRNGIDLNQINTHLEHPSELAKADIIVANILAGPLKELASRFAELLVQKGEIILSGILENQIDGILLVYREYFAMDTPVTKDGWVRITGSKLS